MAENKIKILAVVGSTASGKSALAVALAKALGKLTLSLAKKIRKTRTARAILKRSFAHMAT